METLSAFLYNEVLASFCNIDLLPCSLVSLNVCPSQDWFPRLILLLRGAPVESVKKGGFRELEIQNILLAVTSNGRTSLKMAQMVQISDLLS